MPDRVEHITINGKHRIVLERAASSTKNILGWKIETNSDDRDVALVDIEYLKAKVEVMTVQPEEVKHES